MLFGLFKKDKDHRHYLTKGAKHLAAERYADARVEFLEALKVCPADAAEEQEIRNGLSTAGNRLAELNLHEGERSVNGGELEKAFDHFTLACELAFDESIKNAARTGLRTLQQRASAQPPAPKAAHSHGGSCGGSCKDTGHHQLSAEDMAEPDLTEEERFTLLVQPLPGDLPARYTELGGDFARAYLLIHDGNDAAAFPILQQLLRKGDNDVVIYELALIMYRSGKVHECEEYLHRSLKTNATNPASYLALVHLLAETGRYPEAMETVRRMAEHQVLADQTEVMMGDLQHASGDEAAALDSWSKALALPGMAKVAAERLVPVLSNQGRTDEAKFLAKKYLKGCC